jgi:hypothetical protein
VNWYNANYSTVLAGAEKEFLQQAEDLVYALRPPTPGKYRIIIHALIGNWGTGDTKKPPVLPIGLKNTTSKVSNNVYLSEMKLPTMTKPWFPFINAIREVHEVDTKGHYWMENVNANWPSYIGYSLSGPYKFQSSEDLKLEAVVDDANPISIIRFVPYTST